MRGASSGELGVCPCGRLGARGKPLAFSACCGRWQELPAPDAECLMRSRYTAYVRGDLPYLLASWHPSTRPTSLVLEPGLLWLGLDVRSHKVTGTDSAEVEFVARSRPGGSGPAHRLHERSRFLREAGHWYYLDGDIS